MDVLAQYGYLGLFLTSFLAATILPLGSEVLLSLLLLNGHDPFLTIGVATFGNVLGSLINYALGLWRGMWFAEKLLRLSPEKMAGAENRFKRYGVISLLFVWVPIIGDPLTIVAGALRINICVFLGLVTTGKLLRYILVGLSAVSLFDLFY